MVSAGAGDDPVAVHFVTIKVIVSEVELLC